MEIPRTSLGLLTTEREYYVNGSTIYCYSPSSPDSRYETVEAMYNKTGAGINIVDGATGIQIDHLNFAIIGNEMRIKV